MGNEVTERLAPERGGAEVEVVVVGSGCNRTVAVDTGIFQRAFTKVSLATIEKREDKKKERGRERGEWPFAAGGWWMTQPGSMEQAIVWSINYIEY